MQRVVFERLPVRAARHRGGAVAVDHDARVPAPPIAPAVAQVVVGRQVVPARHQRAKLSQRAAGETGEARGVQRGVALASQQRIELARIDDGRRQELSHRVMMPQGRATHGAQLPHIKPP